MTTCRSSPFGGLAGYGAWRYRRPRFHFRPTVVHPLAMRPSIRCILSALAAGVSAAQPLVAQQATPPATPPATYTVKAGDTLWDLAKQFLGDAFLWTDIYRMNRDVVEDPHWIYPGEVLRFSTPAESTTTVAQNPTTETPPGAGQQQAPQQVSSSNPASALPPTVFSRSANPTPTTASMSLVGRGPQLEEAPTVRVGEVIVAPYVDREGGPRGFGRILKSGELPGITEMTDRSEFHEYDKIFISPPAGDVAPEGARYLAYRLGPVLEHQGQVVIPTGVIEVTAAPHSDLAAVASVVQVFNEVQASDRLVRLDTAGTSTTTRPREVEDGPSTKITWVSGEPVLPSVQSFIVLDASSKQGVQMGDEFLIYNPRTRGEDGNPGDPEIVIGRAQVVRSTPFGVTAVVLGQDQPAIKQGMTARVSARMP